MNDTKIHECLHWYLHKKYVEFGLLSKQMESSIITGANPTQADDIDYEDVEDAIIVEAQCKGITPFVLMPKGPSIVKINQLLNEKSYITNYAERFDDAAREFADFFKVNKDSTN